MQSEKNCLRDCHIPESIKIVELDNGGNIIEKTKKKVKEFLKWISS